MDEKLNGADLIGCRSALRDYLTSRVDRANQYGYLMTVVTWFDGATSAPKGFANLSRSKQALLVAGAVNELLQVSPEDEIKLYRSSRGRAGTTDTLRAKVEFHLRRAQEPFTRREQHEAPSQPGPRIGDPTSKFPEEM